jgi:4-hydroxybenzoate polyprenyltransferase
MTIAPTDMAGPEAKNVPLVVDLDGTFLKVDSLYELFVGALFTDPLATVRALFALRQGVAGFKHKLSNIGHLDVDTLPVREDFLGYLNEELAAGREIHLVTAADHSVASSIADRFPIFRSVHGSDQGVNLKGINKAVRLAELFPAGFVYAGDSYADLPVWKAATAANIVTSSAALNNAVSRSGVVIERVFSKRSPQWPAWTRAARTQQWAKNTVVLVPVILGWHDVTATGLAVTFAMIALLCVAASLTYLINDMADLSSDRKHWSKGRRPLASGAIAIRDALLVVGFGLPITIVAGLLLSAPAGLCLLLYVIVSLGYSFGLKTIPLFDTFIIASLFTIRILIGITAAALVASTWLLAFSMFFFFSLAIAKRHAEILRAGSHGLQQLEGRGYLISDESMTLVFGISASMASIVIVVIYLVEDVFARHVFTQPEWLWVTPVAIFLFACRIWVLAHRARMIDDPVAFALRDRVSLGLGVFVGIAILLAL